mmetsp:Transcript_27346/g.64569  ORF Transcript_27346/g.64569 Transcript_27346/m.64569 type:complete len:217 (-) Transcript_27346:143-793(-)
MASVSVPVSVNEDQAKAMAKKVGTAALDAGKKALATAKTAASEAQQAGLFESANFKAFNSSLVHIINDVKGEVSNVQGGTTTASQAVLNALAFKPNAPDAGFIFMNTLALWVQLLGSVIGWLFGDSVATLISWSLFSYLLAYVLYFAVVVSQRATLMGWAIGGYAVYAVMNALHTVSSLIFVIPPILYGIKTLACGYCAFYAYQLRERISGAVQIP